MPGLRRFWSRPPSAFNSDIRIDREGIEVNGKSIMGIMMLAAAKGSINPLKIEGEDEAEAMSTAGGTDQQWIWGR